MNEKDIPDYQWLSELVDDDSVNALVLEESVDKLTDDVNLLNRWQRYHMIRETIRGGLPESIDMDLTDNIMARIAEEDAKVQPATQQKVQTKFPAIWDSIFSFALTIMVAVTIVFAYDWIEDKSYISQLANQDSQENSLQTAGFLNAFPGLVNKPNDTVETVAVTPVADMDLYLLSHAEYATTPTVMPRILPYARLSSFNASEP